MTADKKEADLPLRAGGGGGPTEEAIKGRVKEFRPDHPTTKHLKKIYQSHAKEQTFQDGVKLATEDAFWEYMRSPAAAALAPPPEVDLSHPLSSYYISSSHNTYLTGHQLYGYATTEGYTNVLKRGCRCLEIDIWDGDDSDSSASSSDEDFDVAKAGSAPKRSKWRRMKEKASEMRGHASRKEQEKETVESPPDSASLHHAHPSHHAHPGAIPGDDSQPFKSEPQVVHGWTLTQAIPFRTVCAAIRKSAFVATDLPLIVSFETHASLDQQETMVEIIKEAWGDCLVDMEDAMKTGFDKLPSPASLRNKILVKVKHSSVGIIADPSTKLELAQTNTTQGSNEAAKKPAKMLPALSELGMFTRAFSFKSWDQPEASIPTHVFSLTESKAHGMHPDPTHGPAMFEHNKKYLTRIYPKGTRITSSNYDPAFHWRHGAQMVALNWQRLDEGMMLNEGMFAGYEGWVLKPDGYRDQDGGVGDSSLTTIPTKQISELRIQAFAAESIPLPREKDASQAAKLKPYLKFELHLDTHGPPGSGKDGEGVNNDTEMEEQDKKEREKHKRRSKTQKSDSPDFEGEALAWTNVGVVEKLSFLR